MESYNNHISGIRSYEICNKANAIAVIFKGGNEVFVFEGNRIGIDHLETMQKLAKQQDGLGRYLSKNQAIRKNFSKMYADADEYKKLYRHTTMH
ncbi:MAG: hypothetical protein PUP46_03160 [Endozoicomonas sp. (ex Botrylloides leachii)]|nr:hypothetical protein [Endozoicomonas sp. (ex Botrylloides leachii)]